MDGLIERYKYFLCSYFVVRARKKIILGLYLCSVKPLYT